MSVGIPCKTQADINKAKANYLISLNEQIDINRKNFDLNRQYTNSGTLPASTQMQDTRTTTEKLEDFELLKQSIVKDLSVVAEPSFAYAIVDGIQNSPLNIDGKLIRFMAQNAPQIADQLSKKYKFGIAGDQNDVALLVQFINTIFTDTKANMQSVVDYAKSTTNITNTKSNVLAVNDIDAIIMNLTDMIKRLRIISTNAYKIPIISEQSIQKINKLTRDFIYIKKLLPSQQVLNKMIETIEMLPVNSIDNDTDLAAVFSILENLPKPNIIFTQLDILNKEINTKYHTPNERVIRECIDNIYSYISPLYEPSNLEILVAYYDRFLAENEEAVKRAQITSNNQLIEDIKQANDLEREAQHAQKVYVINPQTEPVNVRTIVPPPTVEAEGYGIRKRRVGRPKGSGICKPKEKIQLEKPQVYSKFGVLEINNKLLGSGIVKVRRNTKSSINDIPAKRVSSNLQNIFKSIVGGGIPKFEDLTKLDNDEKNYLNRIINKSDLQSKLSIPAPSKDQEEKDIHAFEVMKGEIMSGNDSKEMIKKFKFLTLKLMNQGLLPKTDVLALMENLTLLGY